MVSVMLYPCILCVALLMDLFVLCICELFGETICNMFGCGCYFVVECYGSALLDRSRMVFQRMCVVHVIPVFLPEVLFMYLYVGSYLLI